VLRSNRFGEQFLNMGQVHTSDEVILRKDFVKQTYKRHKSYFEGPYADAFHHEFRSWMDKAIYSPPADIDSVPGGENPHA
jgi:hypothetical protein